MDPEGKLGQHRTPPLPLSLLPTSSPWDAFPTPRQHDSTPSTGTSPYTDPQPTCHLPNAPPSFSFPSSSLSSPAAPSPSPSSSNSSLLSLPPELHLQIVAYLYLPPTRFASAHERNADLTSLSLACCSGLTADDDDEASAPTAAALLGVVREQLFRNVVLRNKRELRWLLRRMDLLGGFVRSVAVAGSRRPSFLFSLPRSSSPS
jgi:hypothetical protein